MKNSKPGQKPRGKSPHDKLATEAAAWDERRLTPSRFLDAPEAVPNASKSVAISLRMPAQLLELLKICAAREGVGYQVLVKKWLDDRLAQELAALKDKKKAAPESGQHTSSSGEVNYAPVFPLRDRSDPRGPHYASGES